MEAATTLDEASLRGQAEIWKYMLGFADSMALRSAVELRIPDIINSHGHAISLSEIASSFDSSAPDISCLSRIMRLLVRRNIFTACHDGEDVPEKILYGLTHSSRWLLRDAELTLAPMVLMQTNPTLMAPWHTFSKCVTEPGPYAFERAHGEHLWQFFSENSKFNRFFNDAMACSAKITTKAILEGYEGLGFKGVETLVDVAGGTGSAVAEIVKAYPSIKGINFDLPHVVATSPMYQGVSHVGGDMFVEGSLPKADAIFMKWIMHDWSDNDCVKILKNCRRAIPERTGKVIIVDIVLEPNGVGVFDDTGLVFDLVMIAHVSGGKERTESEWKKMLEQAGFFRFKITKIPALVSVIEAYPV